MDTPFREYAAAAIADIAHTEPEILDPEDLKRELSNLEGVGDQVALGYIAESLSTVEKAERGGVYKYGL